MPTPTQTRPSLVQDERGMALAIALFAIVVIAALVAGTAFAGQMEMGGGRSALAATQAVEQAETGLAESFGDNWDTNWNSLVADDSSSAVSITSASGLDRRTTIVTRLGGLLFFVRSTGERLDVAGNVLASRTLGELARLKTPNVTVNAAVKGEGDVRVAGTASVSGIDVNPAGWGLACTAPLVDVPGVKASAGVTQAGAATILGSPAPYVANDPTVTPQVFTDTYDALISAVTMTRPGGSYNGMQPSYTVTSSCDKTDLNNWGEPGDPAYPPVKMNCRSYLPVILFTGNTTIQTGKGQGIIIIQGSLDITGTFIFDGIILATGNVNFHGSGGASSRIFGGIFSANSTNVDDDILISGAPVITYSSCSVAAVLASVAEGIPLTHRGWVQVVY